MKIQLMFLAAIIALLAASLTNAEEEEGRQSQLDRLSQLVPSAFEDDEARVKRKLPICKPPGCCRCCTEAEDECNENFNVPKPVDGKGTAYCKNYQDKYKTEEDSISADKYKVMKKNLLDKDPATGSTGDPSVHVHGSLLQEATVTKGKQGCGCEVDMDNFLNIAVIAFGIISLIILFQIVVAVMFCNKKNNKNKSRKSKLSSSSSSS